MVDVHSHLVWGVDDGARSFAESIEMAELAAKSGTSVLVATPHSNHDYFYDAELIDERIRQLRSAVGEKLKIVRGCDMHLSYENVKDVLENPRKYTINAGRYLLVEFSDSSILPSAEKLLQAMIDEGIIPVITHPERNALLRKRLKDLDAWVAQGCLVQITAQSLLGRFGRHAQEFSVMAVKKGRVHIVASDGHDLKSRPPRLDEAYRYVAEEFGEALAHRLFVEIPGEMVAGKRLEVVDKAPRRSRENAASGWRNFFGRGSD